MILDDTNSSGVTITGSWTDRHPVSGYYGSNYLHDNDTGQGTKNVLYSPTLPVSGMYQVYINYTSCCESRHQCAGGLSPIPGPLRP